MSALCVADAANVAQYVCILRRVYILYLTLHMRLLLFSCFLLGVVLCVSSKLERGIGIH